MSPILKKDESATWAWLHNDLKNDLYLVSLCLKQRGKMEQDDYEVGRSKRQRWWYTLKACICILLHRFKNDYFCTKPNFFTETTVDIAVWGFRNTGILDEQRITRWEQIAVARHAWHVHIFDNADA